jgi:hypothetical protein
MTQNIEIAVKLFKAIASNAKAFDKGIRNNPLSLKATFAAYAESAAIAAKAEKGKNEIMRVEMTRRGLPIFWTKQGDKYIQTPALKMELSAIKKGADAGFPELSDEEFRAMIADFAPEISNVRFFIDKMFETPADAKPKASKPKATPAPADNADATPDVIETKTDTRTPEEVFTNFLQVWNASQGANFWDWIETRTDEQILDMQAKAGMTPKAKAA